MVGFNLFIKFCEQILVTEFIKEDSPALPNPCHFQNYDQSMSSVLVPRDPHNVRRRVGERPLSAVVSCLQGYLAHKKTHPPRTLQ